MLLRVMFNTSRRRYKHRYKRNKRAVIKLDENKLDQLTGTYKGYQTGEIKIQREDEHLLMLIGEQRYIIYPESQTVFFTKERDLTFEFVKENNKVSKMIVREKGNIMEEAVKEKERRE